MAFLQIIWLKLHAHIYLTLQIGNMHCSYAKLAAAKSQLANEARNTSTNLARALR